MVQRIAWGLTICAALAVPGCILHPSPPKFDADLAHYQQLSSATPFVDTRLIASGLQGELPPPLTIRDTSGPSSYWDLSLEDALQIAVTRSPILRDLGGTVVRAPATAHTILGPAIMASDPSQGMEGALADFDAYLATRLFFENNDRMVNNFFSSGGARLFTQDVGDFQTQLTKTTASGTRLSLLGTTTYDANNAAGNRFPSAWDSTVEAEVRHPLLQGGGVDFNRIAGPYSAQTDRPHSVPGTYHGVLVARLNTDVSLVDFRIGLRDLVSNVENTYWELYFAYRELDAKVEARNRSLSAWRAVNGMAEAGQPGGEAEREAQFREQYFHFEQEVRNALSGRLFEGTATGTGSSGGAFRGIGGVQVAERRLRLILGLDINDSRLIRPADEPSRAPINYDWHGLVAESMTRREELQRQRLQVRRKELELVASRNFLLPRFDLVGRYRWRGMGENFFAGATLEPGDSPDFANGSLENLFGGHYQEWQLGGELSFPVGFRRAHAAVRNAQLQLARERAVLQEQERHILHDVSNAVADVYRAWDISQTCFNGRQAAQRQIEVLREKLTRRLPVNLDQFIDAERRFADADVQYHRSLAEYMVALKNVQFEKGTLLEYCQVHLTESPTTSPAVLPETAGNRVLQPPQEMSYVMRGTGPADASGGAPPPLSAAGTSRPAPAGGGAPRVGAPPFDVVPSVDPLPGDFSSDRVQRTAYESQLPDGRVPVPGPPSRPTGMRRLPAPNAETLPGRCP